MPLETSGTFEASLTDYDLYVRLKESDRTLFLISLGAAFTQGRILVMLVDT